MGNVQYEDTVRPVGQPVWSVPVKQLLIYAKESCRKISKLLYYPDQFYFDENLSLCYTKFFGMSVEIMETYVRQQNFGMIFCVLIPISQNLLFLTFYKHSSMKNSHN